MLLGLRIGARRLSVAGALVFGAASGACAIASGVDTVIAARCVQAVGGAALAGSALELLVEWVGDERRAARIWAASAAVGAAVGPMAGGALTDAFDWRAIFVVQVPLGLAALLARSPAPRAAPAAAPGAAVGGAELGAGTGGGGPVGRPLPARAAARAGLRRHADPGRRRHLGDPGGGDRGQPGRPRRGPADHPGRRRQPHDRGRAGRAGRAARRAAWPGRCCPRP